MNRPIWFEKLQPYAVSNNYKSLLYILTSIVPYLSLIAIMFLLLQHGFPYWTVLLLSIIAVGFYVRTFMILHDCSHSSFVNSKKISYFLGHFCGILAMTPFFDWQRSHGIHHANVANLDKRGSGDVWTMTLNEYRSAKFRGRLRYRFYRNPFFLFGIAPPLLFFILYRFPRKSTRRKDYFSIVLTNIALALIIVAAYYTVGIKNYFAVQLPILFIATPIGVWLFYIQHQFENVYWDHSNGWDLINAAINGSSFYNLPGLLRWFTGNIGYHNIHHLKPRIPCYNLKRCYDNVPDLHYIVPITLSASFKSFHLHLWDEDTKKLISFKEADKKIKSGIQ